MLSVLDKTTIDCISARDHDCAPGWCAGPRAVHDCMIYVFERGRSRAVIGDDEKAYALGPGDILLVPEGVPQMVCAEPGQSVQVGQMAGLQGMSEMTLRRLFRRALDASPVEYLVRRRIGHACQALRRSPLSVQEIAYESGFNNIAYVYRCFEKITRTTPGKYRTSA